MKGERGAGGKKEKNSVLFLRLCGTGEKKKRGRRCRPDSALAPREGGKEEGWNLQKGESPLFSDCFEARTGEGKGEGGRECCPKQQGRPRLQVEGKRKEKQGVLRHGNLITSVLLRGQLVLRGEGERKTCACFSRPG